MLKLRKAIDRGHFDHGWLKTYHSFSFADYHDPENMGFRTLRVINDDVVLQGEGFGTHPHRDMEIITYPVSGSLQHRDSMGNGSVIRRGEVQYMSAGTGVTHSEFNPSQEEVSHLLQIWILPDRRSYEPTYAQHKVTEEDKRNKLCLLASGTGELGSIQIRQDAKIFASVLEPQAVLGYQIDKKRHVWLQVVQGTVAVNDIKLETGDGLAVSEETHLQLVGGSTSAEVLLFDLA